jgi:hypothetical protein
MEGKLPPSAPKQLLSVADGIFLIGMVIGVAIKALPIVAGAPLSTAGSCLHGRRAA